MVRRSPPAWPRGRLMRSSCALANFTGGFTRKTLQSATLCAVLGNRRGAHRFGRARCRIEKRPRSATCRDDRRLVLTLRQGAGASPAIERIDPLTGEAALGASLFARWPGFDLVFSLPWPGRARSRHRLVL